MKKRVLAAMMASVMVFSMAGCGNGGGATETPAPKTETKEESKAPAEAPAEAPAAGGETLNVWCWDPNFNIYAIEKAAEVYAANGHEGFKVNVTEIQSQDIETKLTTAMSAGDLSTIPDIFLMQDNSFQKYATNYPDIFAELTSSGIDFSQFSEAKVAYSTLNGKNYGVPFDNGAVIGCYRVDLLEQAGFTVEDFTDITWTEFIEKGKVVKEKTGQPMLTSQSSEPDLVNMMMQSVGASCFNEDGSVNMVDNPALNKAIEIYTQLIKEGVLVEVADWDQYIASINNSTVAGVLNGCWIMASITAKEEQSGLWAMTNMPKMEGIDNASNYSNNGGSSWAITSNCQNPELAFDFMNATFAGSTEFYDALIEKGALATWAPAGDSEVYAQEVEFFGNDKVYSKIVDYATKTPSNVTGPFFYDARDAISVALSEITQMGAEQADALKRAQETVEFNMGG